MEETQSPDRIGAKQPLEYTLDVEPSDGNINYEKTWPKLRKKAAEHYDQLVLVLSHMMNIIALEVAAKRKSAGARLTREELEKVFGGNQGAAWAPVTGTKGKRYFQEWILHVRQLCKKGQIKTKQPDPGAIVHSVMGSTDNDKALVLSLATRAIDDVNHIMCDTFIKAIGRHRQFDGILTAGTAASRMIAAWNNAGEVPDDCIDSDSGRLRPENVPVVALFREFAAICMQSASVHQGNLW